MPWLIVTGRGSWTYQGVRYIAGIHEVDEQIATAAREAPVAALVVTEERPEIVNPHTEGPLTLDDIRIATGGVKLAGGRTEPVILPDAEPVYSYDFSCRYCEYEAPSSGALIRHTGAEHEI